MKRDTGAKKATAKASPAKAKAAEPPAKPVKPPRYTKQQVLKACEGCMGIQANVYRQLGISRRAFYDYRKKWPEVQQAINDELEHGLDFAESKLMQKIQGGDLKAITFFLERKGAVRGWSGGKQQIELTAPPEPPIICFTRHDHNAENDDTNAASPST